MTNLKQESGKNGTNNDEISANQQESGLENAQTGDKAMTINLKKPDITELKPRITVFGVGGGGGNAVNNMITGGLQGVDFVVANTDAQALTMSQAERVVQMGVDVTEGLGAGCQPEVGRAAAEECLTELTDHLSGVHMAFVTAGMGGGTGTGAAPVVAKAARDMGILTVGVVTKPFQFEGARRMRVAEEGIIELQKHVDTLIVIPNQNLFRIANDKTTFADAFGMADQVLYSGVACITDLMVKEGLINLDFADVRSVMREMGKAMMGTGEASGDGRAMQAAEAAISNPLLDESSMKGAQGLLISITGGRDMTLFEVDEAATRIREEVDSDANIILGATFDEALEGTIRVSVVATGIDNSAGAALNNQSQAGVAIASAQSVQTVQTAGIQVQVNQGAGLDADRIEQVAERLKFQHPDAEKKMVRTKLATPTLNPVSTASPVVAGKQNIKIEPYNPQSNPQSSGFNEAALEQEFQTALEAELMPSSDSFIPPRAETVTKPTVSTVMPAVKEYPAQPNTVKAEDHAERGPLGLLRKLKNGLSDQGGNADKGTPATEVHNGIAPAMAEGGATVEANRHVPQSSAHVSYAPKQHAKSSLDTHGRSAAPLSSKPEEEELEIPAFLRRQSS